MSTLTHLVEHTLAAALALVAPADCAGCGVGLGADRDAFCGSCRDAMSRAVTWLDDLPALSLGSHDGPLRDAVHRLKYRRRPDLAPRLGRALRPLCEELAADQPRALLVAVPLHPLRLATRGYNQAALLARGAASEWLDRAAPRLCAGPRILERVRGGPSQVSLGGQARRAGPKSAFRVAARPDAPVILVDDVRTTGATALACASALRAADVSVLGLVSLTTASNASLERDVAAPPLQFVDQIA